MGTFGFGEVHATGGSFDVPEVNDHFDRVEKGPAPKKQESINQNATKENGFWDAVGNMFSKAWEWTKGTVADAGDWLGEILSEINKVGVENIGLFVGVPILLVSAFFIFRQPMINFAFISFLLKPNAKDKADDEIVKQSGNGNVIDAEKYFSDARKDMRTMWAPQIVLELGLGKWNVKNKDYYKNSEILLDGKPMTEDYKASVQRGANWDSHGG
ncbi:hypothetical protein ACFO25_14200 [Paenactinomyces guangxiensis]|uniref:Uncharacterized protein n=1 Tax=Paenactinomyces guangxiensis TaxID=1490290 RepID=A0A7W2A8B2_9BACL|nr:hypothetical protein [Paenactinomyces guangxiensis]MBA4493982.1 hypothetical protein [Paenactinomyces guangxiensis]MBH8593403.1 hypothetical protein [Paenactinomyces guangxiensis]